MPLLGLCTNHTTTTYRIANAGTSIHLHEEALCASSLLCDVLIKEFT